MATITQTGNGKGHRVFSLDNTGDETEVIPLTAGETVHIHVTGLSGPTAQILEYVGSNATGVPLSFDGATSFTSNLALNYTAGGKCGITVTLAIGGGTVVVTFTK